MNSGERDALRKLREERIRRQDAEVELRRLTQVFVTCGRCGLVCAMDLVSTVPNVLTCSCPSEITIASRHLDQGEGEYVYTTSSGARGAVTFADADDEELVDEGPAPATALHARLVRIGRGAGIEGGSTAFAEFEGTGPRQNFRIPIAEDTARTIGGLLFTWCALTITPSEGAYTAGSLVNVCSDDADGVDP